MALASIDDYQDITGRTLDDAGITQVTRLLDVASAMVLANAHGQTITQATSTDTLRPAGGTVRFPQRPVTAVSSVVVDGEVVDPDDYRWTPGGNRAHAYLIRRCDGYDALWTDAEITATYTHGWATVPEPIIAAVVDLADAARTSTLDTQTRTSFTLGKWSETTEPGAPVAGRSLGDGLPGPTRSLLDELLGVPGPTSMPVTRIR